MCPSTVYSYLIMVRIKYTSSELHTHNKSDPYRVQTHVIVFLHIIGNLHYLGGTSRIQNSSVDKRSEERRAGRLGEGWEGMGGWGGGWEAGGGRGAAVVGSDMQPQQLTIIR